LLLLPEFSSLIKWESSSLSGRKRSWRSLRHERERD